MCPVQCVTYLSGRSKMGEKIEFPSPVARIHRKRQSLPSSRCIESAQTHRDRVCSLLTRAAYTTLRLIRSYADTSRGSGGALDTGE
jgi:hypothetical protein